MSRGRRDLDKRERQSHDLAWAQLQLDIENNERLIDGLPELTASEFADRLKSDKHWAHYGREQNVSYKGLRLALRELARP